MAHDSCYLCIGIDLPTASKQGALKLLPPGQSADSPWFSVGTASGSDSERVGREAARDAVKDRAPALTIVFASCALDPGPLLAGIRQVVGDSPVVGCSTAGEIAQHDARDGSVVVASLGGPGFSIRTRAVRGVGADSRATGEAAAGCEAELDDRPHRALLLLTDGLSGDQQEIVRGAYAAVGARVPLVGGCAGDGLAMSGTHQFHGDRVLTDSVVAAAIGSERPIGVGVSHGWQPMGSSRIATSTDGTTLLTLDERPALDVYLDHLDAPAAARNDPVAFVEFAQTRPLGLSGRDGFKVRFIARADFSNRSIHCLAAIPQGSSVWIMSGDVSSVLEATTHACVEARDQLEGHEPLGLIAFDCIARRGILGEEGLIAEIELLKSASTGAPVAGFYTYGEIARTRGINGFHNQTMVVLALS